MELAPHAEPFASGGAPRADGADRGPPQPRLHRLPGVDASLGEHLAALGYAVSVPRLPGHGTTWQDMNSTTFADWYAEVERAFEKLRTESTRSSSAGSRWAAAGAPARRQPPARRRRSGAGQRRGLQPEPPAARRTPGKRLMPGPQRHRQRHQEARRLRARLHQDAAEGAALDVAGLEAGARRPAQGDAAGADLPVPRGPRRGRAVHPQLLAGISSRDVTERVLDDSYHVATLDNDAPQIFAESAEFIARVTGSPPWDTSTTTTARDATSRPARVTRTCCGVRSSTTTATG